MDVGYHLDQGLLCLRQAKLAEDPVVKGRLVAMARANLDMVRRYGPLRPRLRQKRAGRFCYRLILGHSSIAFAMSGPATSPPAQSLQIADACGENPG